MKLSTLNILAAAALTALLAGCDDHSYNPVLVVDDNSAVSADTPATEVTYKSLTFHWDRQTSVNQYGYILTGPDGEVASGITDKNHITFDDLEPNTTYTLELSAYGQAGRPTYRTWLTGKTLPIYVLATPKVTGEQQGYTLVLSWEPVENAQGYEYTYEKDGETVTVATSDELSATFIGYKEGDHEFSVRAVTTQGGWADSEPASVTINRHRNLTASVSGTWTSGLATRNNKWDAMLMAYDDGSYVIPAFYNVEGYDLEMAIDLATGAVTPITGNEEDGTLTMDTGRTGTMASVTYLFGDDGEGGFYSFLTGDLATTGKITLKTQSSAPVARPDSFVW